MTENEKNREKLATMQELSETNGLLECLKGRMEQWSAMIRNMARLARRELEAVDIARFHQDVTGRPIRIPLDSEIGNRGHRLIVVGLVVLVAGAACMPTVTEQPATQATIGDDELRWECCDLYSNSRSCFGKETLVSLTADPKANTGTITIDDNFIVTHFDLDGLDYRWNWGISSDQRYNYGFIIDPGRTSIAKYVVFRGIEGRTTKPNTLYRCNRQ